MTTLSSISSPQSADRRRWFALAVVCLAQLMNVLDSTVVNVALPSIQHDLHFSQGNLTWVINAFLVTFGSFLLLAGRLGDLAGRKRVFLTGVVIFTSASAVCGLSDSAAMLIAARFVQGFGAALQASVILAIIVTEFPEATDRAKAMSSFVFVSVAGGSLGLLIGGVLTQTLSWHWIFFINIPIGIVTLLLGRVLIPTDRGVGFGEGLDWLGALLSTAALASAVYAIVSATGHGWGSTQVLGTGVLALALAAVFLYVESRVRQPMMPLRILRLRGLIGSSVVRGFLVTGMYSTFFLGTLYLEKVRGYGTLETGLAWLPWTLTVAALSLGFSAKLVARFGAIRVLCAGMLIAMVGLALLASAGPDTAFFPTIGPAFFLGGLGVGLAFMPLLQIAMADVPVADAGLGSGIVNVSQQVSGALGLALLGTIADNHTRSLLVAHDAVLPALTAGYRLAFLTAVGAIGAGLVIALLVLRQSPAATEVELVDEFDSDLDGADFGEQAA
jgi:EmrB/QacA subfamily drug resistance transporter